MRALAIWALIACRHGPPAQLAPAPGAAGAPHNAAIVPRTDAPTPRRVIATSHIETLSPIRFFAGSPNLMLVSQPMLDAIAATLTSNPSILLVEVRADGSDGPAALQQRLGNQRAQLIVDELVRRKVDPKRLVAHGLATGAAGVELEILRRAPLP